jgi:hypothetical protein
MLEKRQRKRREEEGEEEVEGVYWMMIYWCCRLKLKVGC